MVSRIVNCATPLSKFPRGEYNSLCLCNMFY